MSAWHPIETAPKDGTRILVCLDPKRYRVPVHITFWDGREEWPHWWNLGDWPDIAGWMPLPEPPAEKKAGK